MAKKLPVAQQQQRDQRMAFEYARGSSPERIAAIHNVSERTVRRALARWRKQAPELTAPDPIDAFRDQRLRFEAAISELGEMRNPKSPDRVDGLAKTEAIRLQMRVMQQIWDLDTAMGFLPAADWNSPASREAVGRSYKRWLRQQLGEKEGWEDDVIGLLEQLFVRWLRYAKQVDERP